METTSSLRGSYCSRHPVVETIADHVLLQGGVAFIDQRHHGRVEIVLDREHAAMIAAAMSQEKPPSFFPRARHSFG